MILLTGIQRALGREPALPERLLRVRLPARFLKLTLGGAGRLLGWLEGDCGPAWNGLLARAGEQRAVGRWRLPVRCSCCLLPVPLSNFFPAATVLLLTAGHLERDGRAVLAGFGMFAVTLAFFAGIGLGGAALSEHVQQRFFPAE